MNFGLILLSCVVSLFVLWIIYRLWNQKLFKQIAEMDDLNGLPLIGMAHHFIGKPAKDYFKIVNDLIKFDSIGKPLQFWICSKLCIVLSNSEDIRKVLASQDCYEKGSCYDLAPIKNGLLTAKPTIWENHRKLLGSTLNTQMLNKCIPDFNKTSKKIVFDFEPLCGNGTFSVAKIIGNHIVDVQLRTLFGSVENSEVLTPLHNNMLDIAKLYGEAVLLVNCHPIVSAIQAFIFLMYTRIDKIKFNENYNLLKSLLGTDKKTLTKDPNEPEIFIKRVATLHNLRKFDDTDMSDHINTMLLAGSDTLMVSLHNIIILLAMNPSVQDKCYNEIIDNLGTDFHEVNIDQLSNLIYLDCTIKECLRLVPPVPLIQRRSAIDIPISTGTIPKGVDICIPIQKIHMNPEYWGEEPTRFNPDNFLKENMAKRPILCYLPYIYGKRNCIAAKYAHTLMRIIMAHLISKFKFSTDLKFDKLRFEYGITMTIDQLIKVEKR